MSTFLSETARDATAKLDWFGFGTLSLAIGALQSCWTVARNSTGSAPRDRVEAVIGASALYLFLVHTFTAREPFVRRRYSATATLPPARSSSPSSA